MPLPHIQLHVSFNILMFSTVNLVVMSGPLKINSISNLFKISCNRCILERRPLSVSSSFFWHPLNGTFHFKRSVPHASASTVYSLLSLFPHIKIIWCIFVALILIGHFSDFQGNGCHLFHICPSFSLEKKNSPSTRRLLLFYFKIFYSNLLWKFKCG